MGGDKQRTLRYRVTALSVFLAALLLAVAACAPPPPAPPPIIRTPSTVITEEGYQFYVYGLKLSGTRQELKLKIGGTLTWLPLSDIQLVTFTGLEEKRFRPADIIIIDGGKLHGELFVDRIIEGTTDLGYWNARIGKIKQISMGSE